MSNEKKLKEEITSFQKIWQGGYFEGDPLDPLSKSSYSQIGYVSVLHATYLRCIKPYIKENTVALEIGPGRGSWTRCLLPAQQIYVLDALSADHNNFYSYIPNLEKVTYVQVKDFSCEDLPDNHFDYMFSFGALCHISFEGISEYALNLNQKLKPGANCFWMIADYQKYNSAISNLDRLGIIQSVLPDSFPFRASINKIIGKLIRRNKLRKLTPDLNDTPSPGRWYDAELLRTCEMLEKLGYVIIDSDVGTCLRDPIIHFQKK